MPLEYVKRYSREMVRSRPEAWFVFGDNMERRGRGGQAAACRDEPNTIGIPTKWFPHTGEQAYFSDADFDLVEPHICGAVAQIRAHLMAGHTVVLPEDGIGTGLARLGEKAPAIATHLQELMDGLSEFAKEIDDGMATD